MLGGFAIPVFTLNQIDRLKIRNSDRMTNSDESTAFTTQQQPSCPKHVVADVAVSLRSTSTETKPDDVAVTSPPSVTSQIPTYQWRKPRPSPNYTMKNTNTLGIKAEFHIAKSSLDENIKLHLKNEMSAFKKDSKEKQMYGWSEHEKASWIARLQSVRKTLLLKHVTNNAHKRGSQWLRIMDKVFDQ